MSTTADTRLYTLYLAGGPDTAFLVDYCPAGTTLTIQGHIAILANLRADQAGLFGIIRSLHNLGCTLIALATDPGENT